LLIQCSYTAGPRLIRASYTSRYRHEPAWSIYPQDVAAESGKVIKEKERRGNSRTRKRRRKKERKSSKHFRSKEKKRDENKRDCKGYKD
jgi:hypothetical protein